MILKLFANNRAQNEPICPSMSVSMKKSIFVLLDYVVVYNMKYIL